MIELWHFLVHWTGSDYGTTYGRFIPYDFLSGFFGGSAFLTATLVLWRAHTCHRFWWCWRHPFFQVEGSPYKLCRRHYPKDTPSVAEVVNGTVD